MKLKKSIVLVLAAVVSQAAYAQRTAIGTKFVTLQAVTSFSGAGASVDVGLYGATGLWKVLVSESMRSMSLNNAAGSYAGKAGYMHLELGGGYLWRIYANHGRTVNVYGGPGVFVGAEFIDPFNRRPANTLLPFEKTEKFLYGIDAQLEAEVFPLRLLPNLAFVLTARLPFNFSSQLSKVNFDAALGVRYNF